jgi:small subunit ribosomal protein S13
LEPKPKKEDTEKKDEGAKEPEPEPVEETPSPKPKKEGGKPPKKGEESEKKDAGAEETEPEPEEKTSSPQPKKEGGKPSKKGDDDEEVNPDFKYIVRIANTDIDGNKTVENGLTSIKGIGTRLGEILADKAGIDRKLKMGDLSDEDVDKLIDVVGKINELIPPWILNRQNDVETGEDLHIYGAEIFTYKREDLNRLKKIRCYRGIRHERGHKVRGQRTRANGRTGLTVGVVKKSVRQQQAKTAAKKKK